MIAVAALVNARCAVGVDDIAILVMVIIGDVPCFAGFYIGLVVVFDISHSVLDRLNDEGSLFCEDVALGLVFLERFNKIVKENLSDSEFSAEDIARKLNMSRSTVYRRVKRITDMSIVDYLRSLRLKQSRLMLEEGHGVSETAFACGFGDAGYFSVSFKKEYGISPTLFKKSLRKYEHKISGDVILIDYTNKL